MRFICDVCPATASKGESVIIGHYEKWIRHLLSPQHQTEQNLVLSRTSYWPDAKWVVIIKSFPDYNEVTAELYVDVMMKLSEYGFIEAIYYGSKLDSVCIAIQLYETNPVPAHLQSPDGFNYEVKTVPRMQLNAMNGSSAGTAGSIGRRRFRFYSTPSAVPENESSKTMVNVATSPIPCAVLNMRNHSPESDIGVIKRGIENVIFKNTQNGPKKTRIKYDRDTLLQFRDETSMPKRFSEILAFPKYLIADEVKCVDPLKMQQVQWVVDENAGAVNYRTKDFGNNSSRVPLSRGHWNQNGWKNNSNSNVTPRWKKFEQSSKSDEDDNVGW